MHESEFENQHKVRWEMNIEIASSKDGKLFKIPNSWLAVGNIWYTQNF